MRAAEWRKAAIGVGLGLSCAALGAPANAQDLKDEIANLAASGNLGKGFQTIAVLGATPGISNTTLRGDALTVSTLKAHIPHRFARWREDGTPKLSPFIEGTVGFAKAKETIAFQSGRPDDFRLDMSYKSRSFLFGGGVVVPLGGSTRLKPMALLGHTSLSIDSRYDSLDADLFNSIYDGLLVDAAIKTTFVGGALQVDHDRKVLKDGRLSVSGRYSHYVSVADEVTSPGLKPRGTTGIATVNAVIEKPTGLYLGEREVFAGVFARGNALFGKGRDLFGFNRFAEIGGSLKLDYPVDKGFGLGVTSSIVRGPGVKGYTIGLLLRFGGADLVEVR